MTCKRIDLGADTAVWSCSRGSRVERPPCSVCGQKPQALECGYELRGVKSGQVCGKKICGSCARSVGADVMCPAHARLVCSEQWGGRR